jgi:hypothetical protein
LSAMSCSAISHGVGHRRESAGGIPVVRRKIASSDFALLTV